MVNRMVFFYVYVIAERFTSDFGESLRPVLFSPTEPKNTPMIHDLIQDSQVESENKRKRSRHAPKGQRAHSPGHRPGYDEAAQQKYPGGYSDPYEVSLFSLFSYPE